MLNKDINIDLLKAIRDSGRIDTTDFEVQWDLAFLENNDLIETDTRGKFKLRREALDCLKLAQKAT